MEGLGDSEECRFREQMKSRVENPAHPSNIFFFCGSQKKKKPGTEKGTYL